MPMRNCRFGIALAVFKFRNVKCRRFTRFRHIRCLSGFVRYFWYSSCHRGLEELRSLLPNIGSEREQRPVKAGLKKTSKHGIASNAEGVEPQSMVVEVLGALDDGTIQRIQLIGYAISTQKGDDVKIDHYIMRRTAGVINRRTPRSTSQFILETLQGYELPL